MDPDLKSIDEFWQGKRCLITGADGFLANHLANILIRYGAMVYGINRNRKRILSTLDRLDHRDHMTIFPCDVRDYRSVLDVITCEKIDTVFHLAAVSTTGVGGRSPLATLETNVMGTGNVLEACRQSGVQRIVVASTDKAYGDHRSDMPFTEMHSLRGLRMYDCSKSCTDLIAQTYYFQFQLPIRITRCSNIYGPGDLNFSRLIPGTIARILENIPPMVHPSQAEAQREYLFIDDAVEAYLAIAKSISNEPENHIPSTGEDAYSHCAFNVGSGSQNVKTTQELSDLIAESMGAHVNQEKHPFQLETSSGLPDHQFVDSAKIQSDLNWAARYDLKDGLRKTVSWYRENQEALKPIYLSEITPSS